MCHHCPQLNKHFSHVRENGIVKAQKKAIGHHATTIAIIRSVFPILKWEEEPTMATYHAYEQIYHFSHPRFRMSFLNM